MSNKLILYSCWTSSCSYRARIALNLKRLDYELIPIDINKNKDHHTTSYSSINPNMMVPTLVHNGQVFVDSMAIVEYLDDKFPEPNKLLPERAEDKARVRALCYSPLHCLRVRNYANQGDKQKGDEWAWHWIKIGSDSVEKMLEKTSGKYAYGDTFTLADLCIPPHVFNARDKMGFDMSRYPIMSRIDKMLMEMPEFQKAHPYKQPDCAKPY